MAPTWTQVAQFASPSLPNDVTANSLSVAPVSGDATAVGIKLGNGTSTLFSVDATGKLIAASSAIQGNESVLGNLTVGGTLTANGLTNTGSGTAAGLYSSIAGSASTPSIGYANQSDTGIYLATQSATAAIIALAVNGVQALALSKSGATVPGTFAVSGASTFAGVATGALTASSINDTGTLNVGGATTLAALSATSISGASLTLTGNLAVSGNETVSGTSTIAGLLTANGNVATPLVKTTQSPTSSTVNSASYTVSNLQLPGSFGDGNNYPLSGVSSDSLGNLALNYQGVPAIKMANTGYSSQAANTPGSPFFTNFLSGEYNFGVGSNTQLTINPTAVKFGFTANTVPVTMQAFSGNILQLQNGGTSPNFTTTTVGTVDSSGNATFAGVMKASSVTFGDGTSQTTAYTATSASNQAKYTATSNGTTALPAFTYASNTDTGEYLKTSSTSAAVLALSVNATDAMTLTKSGVQVPGALAVTGTTTSNTFGGAASGSVSAPIFYSTQYANTGIYFSATPAMVVTANGTAGASFNATSMNVAQTLNAQSALAVTGAATLSSTLNVTGTTTLAAANTGALSASTLSLSGAATLNSTLAVTGTSTLAAVNSGALTSTAAVKGTALTITASGGALTFGDGTTQTTAATAAASGQSAIFAATSNGSNTAPVFSSKQYTNTGIYFNPNSTTSTNWDVAIDGTQVVDWSSTNLKFLAQITGTAQTLTGVSSAASFSSTSSSATSNLVGGLNVGTALAVTGAASVGGVLQVRNGTATAPGVAFSSDTTTGFSAQINPSTIFVNCAGVTTASFTKTLTSIATPASVTGTVTSTTAAGTPSFVSTQGFKQNLMASFWNSTYTANTASQMQLALVNNGNNSVIGSTPYVFTFPFAGSVLALNFNQAGPVGGTNSFSVYKNGTSVVTYTSTATSGATTYTKGTYAFAAGDVLTLFHSNNTSGNTQVLLHCTIEMGA